MEPTSGDRTRNRWCFHVLPHTIANERERLDVAAGFRAAAAVSFPDGALPTRHREMQSSPKRSWAFESPIFLRRVQNCILSRLQRPDIDALIRRQLVTSHVKNTIYEAWVCHQRRQVVHLV